MWNVLQKRIKTTMGEEFPNETKGSNCQENHCTFSRTCNIYKREKEIMKVKYRKIICLEARKIMETYIKDSTYANIAQKASPITEINNLPAIPKINPEPNTKQKI